MNRTLLIIDDDATQAKELCTALSVSVKNVSVQYAATEEEIREKVDNTYFSMAIVDLRMDKFTIDGFWVMDRIALVNPYAKIIAISAFTGEYLPRLKQYLTSGRILDICEKKTFPIWVPELTAIIEKYLGSGELSPIQQALVDTFADAKNESDTYKKGVKFENFVVFLFRQMGFSTVSKRVRDDASNEVDILIRNELDDPFFSKFGRYIFVECKNRQEGFSKNDYIIFKSKVDSSSGNADLGVVFAASYIKDTVKLQELKESYGTSKILLLSSPEIEKLIRSDNMLETFKEFIDDQVL